MTQLTPRNLLWKVHFSTSAGRLKLQVLIVAHTDVLLVVIQVLDFMPMNMESNSLTYLDVPLG